MKALAPVLVAVAMVASAGPARADPAQSLAAIFERCADTAYKACAERLWAFADVTGDDRLTLAELTRFFRTAAEAMTSGDAAAPGTQAPAPAPALPGMAENDRAYAVGSAFITGPIAAKLIIANYDYDDDGVIARGEMFLDLDEQAFHQLMVEESQKLPQRAGGLMMRALQAQQQFGVGAPAPAAE
jgi:hypothetical protein